MIAAIESASYGIPAIAEYLRTPFGWTLSDHDLIPQAAETLHSG